MVIYCIFKISSFFGNYLENSTVKRGGQPHGSDRCGYIHLLYRSNFWFTVIEVEHLCRLGCEDMSDKIPADMRSYTVTAENLLVVAGKHKLPNQIRSTNQVENDNNIHRVKEIINHKKYYRNYYWRKTALECTVRSSA